MTRFLLAGATAVLALVAAPSANAAGCYVKDLSGCRSSIGEAVCGYDGHQCGIERCHYWTDYPTCVY